MRSFIILAEVQNYHLAAEKLCITQSTLTKQIQSIENEIGTQLFVRSNKGTELSVQGKSFYGDIKEIITSIDALKNKMSKLPPNSVLTIGFGMATKDVIPSCLTTFSEKKPDFSFKLLDLTSEEQNKQLLSGAIDIGFMRQNINSPLEQINIKNDYLIVICHPNKKQCSQSELLHNNHIFCISSDACSGIYETIIQFCKRSNINKEIEPVSSYENICSLVEADIGVAIIPHSALPKNNVAFIKIDDPLTIWQIVLAKNINIPNKLRDNFIQHVQQQLGLSSFETSTLL